MKIKLSITVEVDAEAWIDEYGLPSDEVRADVLSWAKNTLNESAAPIQVVQLHK
jgi:hypothetical protein